MDLKLVLENASYRLEDEFNALSSQLCPAPSFVSAHKLKNQE